MNVKKAQETSPARQQQQQQGSASLSAPSQAASLNDRYGKIGISAVAGACQHKGEKSTVAARRVTHQDSD